MDQRDTVGTAAMERIGEARSVARHRHARLRRSRACCQVWRTLLHANDFNPGRAARGKGASCRPPAEYSRIDSRPSKWSKTVEGTLWWPASSGAALGCYLSGKKRFVPQKGAILPRVPGTKGEDRRCPPAQTTI